MMRMIIATLIYLCDPPPPTPNTPLQLNSQPTYYLNSLALHATAVPVP